MRLHEYQSKDIFRQYEIPSPNGIVCTTSEEVVQAVRNMDSSFIKAQVLVGGRGKAGGIIKTSLDNASKTAAHILDLRIKGLPVRKVLVEESIDIEKEFYIAITQDRITRRPLLMASASGGIDIEEVAKATPHLIYKVSIDPCIGFMPHQLLYIAKELEITDTTTFSKIIKNLYALFEALDCSLAEINPLVITKQNQLIALDAKINIDDNALFRQREMQELYSKNLDDFEPQEVQAKKLDMSYVDMDGDIGCIVNGAGLALATLDMIASSGGTPANFMDVRGGADAFHVGSAVELTASNPKTLVLLINMFGGLTLCDEIAQGLRDTLKRLDIPVVIRLTGTNQEKGWNILSGANVTVAHSTFEAARLAVEMVR